MSSVVVLKLLAIFAVIAVGWVAGRTRVLGPEAAGVLNRAAFNVFTPALLFHTTAAIAVVRLPWVTLAAYFGPVLLVLFAAYAWSRLRHRDGADPAVRGLTLSFSNTVQLGIPVVTAIFGAPGLTVLIAIVSLQALVLLTIGTVLAEIGLARRPDAGARSLGRVVADTVRRSLIHPVVLPVLLGLSYNATGWPVPGPVEDVLAILGSAVVPVSLVTIGLTLHLYGVAGYVAQAVAYSIGKLLVLPTIVFLVAYVLFGLTGLPLVVSVLAAALPIGANVLLFAGRYDTLQAETTAAIVASTLGFAVTGTLWLFVLSLLL